MSWDEDESPREPGSPLRVIPGGKPPKPPRDRKKKRPEDLLRRGPKVRGVAGILEKDAVARSRSSAPSADFSYPTLPFVPASSPKPSSTQSSPSDLLSMASDVLLRVSTSVQATSQPTASSQPSSKTARRFRLPPLFPRQKELLTDPARDVACVSSTQIGKTFSLACWLIGMAWCDKRRVYPYWWVAPTYKQVEAGFRYLIRFTTTAGILDGRPIMYPNPRIKLINGVEIEGRSWEREENLMGTSIAGGVVDEAGLLTPLAHGAISSRRSATLGPLRYIGNPGLVAGPFRKICMLGEKAMATGLQRDLYSFHKWTWKDRYDGLISWGQFLQAEEYRKFIEAERDALPDFEFRRLYEAEWTDDEAAVFVGVKDAFFGEPLPGPLQDTRYVMGVDSGQIQDPTVATIASVKEGRAVNMMRYRGIPYPQSAQRIKDYSRRWNAPILIEINGPGIALYQELQKLGGVSVYPFKTTNESKNEIIMQLAADIQHKRWSSARMDPAEYEHSIFRYEKLTNGSYRYGAPMGEHDDTVISAALANKARKKIPATLVDFGS